MGQKVSPIGFRLGINKNWNSRWFKSRNYSDWVIEDYKLRSFIYKTQKLAGIAKIVIERAGEKCKIGIYVLKPGIIIGKKGADIETLKIDLSKMSNLEGFLDILLLYQENLRD
jgi:small subunit ribosomal protein S3